MDFYIHYTALPQGKSLADVVGELNEVLEDDGWLTGSGADYLELELEDEKVNPKFAQMAVKAYLQRAQFPRDTRVELGGMEIGVYE